MLFHCSGGKDRTGVAAMLILLALGASDETIYADFVQTNECRRPELEKIWAEHAEAYLEAEYGLTPARLMRLRRMYLE